MKTHVAPLSEWIALTVEIIDSWMRTLQWFLNAWTATNKSDDKIHKFVFYNNCLAYFLTIDSPDNCLVRERGFF